MIYSQYTRFFTDIDGKSFGLLVNSLSGAVDLIACDVYAAWHERVAPEVFPEHARTRLLARGHFHAGSEETEHTFFVSASAALHEKSAAEATNAFWIIPTYRCNLRCSYCFQDHAMHAADSAFDSDLSPQEATGLIENLDRYGGIGTRPGQPRYLTLFGGEPLMRSVGDAVRTLVKCARNKGYKISAVTNGVELSHFVDVLGPDLIRWVQVTLDGIGGSHEKRRTGCGQPSFAQIADGIDIALARGVKVSLRTNVDRKLLDELTTMDEWIKARGWTTYKNFRWYTSPVETHSNESLRKITATTPDLIAHWSHHRSIKARPPYVGKHTATLRRLRQNGIAGRVETSACGAHSGMLFFDPRGDIYACAEQAGQRQFAVGNWRNVNVRASNLPWSERHVGASAVCSRCPNAFFCGGGCANAALNNGGDFFGPRCNGIKEAIDFASREFARGLIADKAIADALGASGSYSVNDDGIVITATSPEHYAERVSCARL